MWGGGRGFVFLLFPVSNCQCSTLSLSSQVCQCCLLSSGELSSTFMKMRGWFSSDFPSYLICAVCMHQQAIVCFLFSVVCFGNVLKPHIMLLFCLKVLHNISEGSICFFLIRIFCMSEWVYPCRSRKGIFWFSIFTVSTIEVIIPTKTTPDTVTFAGAFTVTLQRKKKSLPQHSACDF